MLQFHEMITFTSTNEHDLEHDTAHNKLFSIPKIYDAKGDITKRWYVYFSFKDPETGKLKRMKNIYGKANQFHTKEARYEILSMYRKRLLKLLQLGFNPFQDNSALFQKHFAKNVTYATESAIEITTENKILQKSNPKLFDDSCKTNRQNEIVVKQEEVAKNKTTTILQQNNIKFSDAFEKAISLKQNIVSKTTLSDYRNHCKKLCNWISNKRSDITFINEIDKKTVIDFLNDLQLKTSARNRNNYRTSLSSIFQLLEDNEMIDKNFIKSISVLKSKSTRNKSYTQKEQEAIFKHLEKEDPLLLLYIKFISFGMLRPIEVCRLTVGDIDLKAKTLSFKAKNSPLKTKIIPEILFKDLPDLSKANPSSILFTPESLAGNWDTDITNRRDYFSKRYKKLVKDFFGFDENYGLYSFRHTYITKIYKSLSKEYSPFAAKSKLMQITGHSSMAALEKYLRDIDAELPEDFSNHLT